MSAPAPALPGRARLPVARGQVRVAGTRTRPVLWVHLPNPGMYHPTMQIMMRTWLRRELRARPHEQYENTWVLTSSSP